MSEQLIAFCCSFNTAYAWIFLKRWPWRLLLKHFFFLKEEEGDIDGDDKADAFLQKGSELFKNILSFWIQIPCFN